MFFYEWFILFVFSVIGTIVGSVITFGFVMPLGIFKHWLIGGPTGKKVTIKEVKKF